MAPVGARRPTRRPRIVGAGGPSSSPQCVANDSDGGTTTHADPLPLQRWALEPVPKTTVSLDDESTAKKTLRLIDALEENDDVQEVYSNFDIPERVMEAVV